MTLFTLGIKINLGKSDHKWNSPIKCIGSNHFLRWSGTGLTTSLATYLLQCSAGHHGHMSWLIGIIDRYKWCSVSELLEFKTQFYQSYPVSYHWWFRTCVYFFIVTLLTDFK